LWTESLGASKSKEHDVEDPLAGKPTLDLSGYVTATAYCAARDISPPTLHRMLKRGEGPETVRIRKNCRLFRLPADADIWQKEDGEARVVIELQAHERPSCRNSPEIAWAAIRSKLGLAA
jgi:hypothetical protein